MHKMHTAEKVGPNLSFTAEGKRAPRGKFDGVWHASTDSHSW